MSTAGWLVFLAAVTLSAARVGYLAGREAAERRACATIADLRQALHRGLTVRTDTTTRNDRYLTDDERRPE